MRGIASSRSVFAFNARTASLSIPLPTSRIALKISSMQLPAFCFFIIIPYLSNKLYKYSLFSLILITAGNNLRAYRSFPHWFQNILSINLDSSKTQMHTFFLSYQHSTRSATKILPVEIFPMRQTGSLCDTEHHGCPLVQMLQQQDKAPEACVCFGMHNINNFRKRFLFSHT